MKNILFSVKKGKKDTYIYTLARKPPAILKSSFVSRALAMPLYKHCVKLIYYSNYKRKIKVIISPGGKKK